MIGLKLELNPYFASLARIPSIKILSPFFADFTSDLILGVSAPLLLDAITGGFLL